MLASLKVVSNTSLTNSRKDTKMDWNQAREILDVILKEMNIRTLTISEDNVTISFQYKEQEIPKVVAKSEPIEYAFKSRESKIRHSRKKLKDPRWIKIIDTLHITPKEWIDREYPGLNYGKLMSYMYRNKTKSIRECCEYCRE